MDSAICALCQGPADAKRKRRLYGNSCDVSRVTLEHFVSKNLGLTLDAVVELCDSGSYLCHVCRKKLETVPSLESKLAAMQKELGSLKDELNLKVTQLTPKSIVIGTKRAALPIISEEYETDVSLSESLASANVISDSMELQPTPVSSCSASSSTQLHAHADTNNTECSDSAMSSVLTSSSTLGPSTPTPISNLSKTPKSKKSQPSVSPKIDVSVYACKIIVIYMVMGECMIIIVVTYRAVL